MSNNILEVAASSEWQAGLQTHNRIRNFDSVVMDEPAALGGQDQGPNPLEYLLASLNGCKGVMIPLIAQELNFEFSELSFDTKGTVDLRGLMGDPNVSTYFQNLTFQVNIKTSEPAERLQTLQDKVAERCPVYNLLRDAGVLLQAQWTRV